MRAKPFRKIPSTDKDFNLLQDNLKEILDTLTKNPLLGGNLVSATLATGDNRIAHGLGRNWTSCLAALPSVASSLSLTPAQADRSQWVNVTASAPCAVTLLVL